MAAKSIKLNFKAIRAAMRAWDRYIAAQSRRTGYANTKVAAEVVELRSRQRRVPAH